MYCTCAQNILYVYSMYTTSYMCVDCIGGVCGCNKWNSALFVMTWRLGLMPIHSGLTSHLRLIDLPCL